MNTKLIIYTVNALCGAGKTHSAIQHAITLAAAGERVVIAQPTVDLSKESKADCQSRLGIHHVKITLINRSNTASVKEAVKKHLSTPSKTGEILFITHSAWSLVCDDGWQNKENWHLIIDEVPPVDKHFWVNVPDNHKIFTDHLQTGDVNNNGYSQLTVRPNSVATVKDFAFNRRGDSVSKIFQELATWLTSPFWEVWVEDNAYNVLRSKGDGQINASAILKPSIMDGFSTVTVMSALFPDTNMSVLWSNMGVSFEEHDVIGKDLRYDVHANGANIEIRYMYDALYSENKDKKHDLFGLMAKAVKSETAPDEPFLWLANIRHDDGAFDGMLGKQLPNTPHGQNGYQDYHKIAFMPTLNYRPFHCGFLCSVGFDSLSLQRTFAFQSTYQACMRTSIRNPQDNASKTIYVFSKQIALWLQQLFQGSKVVQIPDLPEIDFRPPGRPAKEPKPREVFRLDRNARVRKSRAKKKAGK
jgi:hypothetical protein